MTIEVFVCCFLFIIISVIHSYKSFTQQRYQYRNVINKLNQGESDEQWGVSFIGQDVCGSKYNDDPFSEIDKKPDAFEIFQKKLKAIEEKNNNNKTISNAGKWP